MALSDAALTTLATVKSDLGITTSTDDDTLARFVEASSARISRYCNRAFYYETGITESVAGYGDTKLVVSRSPLASIASITYDGSTVDSDNYEIGDANAGVIYSKYGWVNTSGRVNNITQDPYPGSNDKSYEVTYTAGWVTPNQADINASLTRDLPHDLEQACIDLVTFKYRMKGVNPTIKSEKLLSYSVTYGEGSSDEIPSGVRSVLDAYVFHGIAK